MDRYSLYVVTYEHEKTYASYKNGSTHGEWYASDVTVPLSGFSSWEPSELTRTSENSVPSSQALVAEEIRYAKGTATLLHLPKNELELILSPDVSARDAMQQFRLEGSGAHRQLPDGTRTSIVTPQRHVRLKADFSQSTPDFWKRFSESFPLAFWSLRNEKEPNCTAWSFERIRKIPGWSEKAICEIS